MRQRWVCAVVLCALVHPLAMEAQRPIWIGLAGGASLPEGDLRDGAGTGWHALGTIGLSTLMQPIGLRLDVAYNRFAFTDDAVTVLGDGNHSVGSATLNFTYRLPMTDSPMSPFLISGLGAYRTECSADTGCDASTKYGWNVGLGTKLYSLGFRSFLEARYHRTSRAGRGVHFFPITLGVMF